jgi:hypothetical protein
MRGEFSRAPRTADRNSLRPQRSSLPDPNRKKAGSKTGRTKSQKQKPRRKQSRRRAGAESIAPRVSCARPVRRNGEQMNSAKEFVCWALTHARPSSIPEDALLPVSRKYCGTEIWNYLYGSVRVRTDKATLDRYFENHYKAQMTRERFDALTADWPEDGFATDCQGLLDAWLTYIKRKPTDINADMNYRLWCADKGRIGEIAREWRIGEAVFRANDAGKMTHVGWICGFMPGGDPLVVEARGIAYGVVVTRLSRRDFTHRGIMSTKFDYEAEEKPMTEPVIFEKTSPMAQGEAYLAMQKALNLAGYTDGEGKTLEEDGKWGGRSQQAFGKLIAAHAAGTAPTEETPENPEENPTETPTENPETGAEEGMTPVVLCCGGVRITVEQAG